MDAKPSKKPPVVTLVAAAVGAGVGAMLARQYVDRPAKIDAALVATASQINQTLPMMVDKETRLDNTMAGPGKTIIYRYTLVNVRAADVHKEQLTSALRPRVLANYKTDSSMKAFRDQGVAMEYQYSDKNGAYITSFSVSPKDF